MVKKLALGGIVSMLPLVGLAVACSDSEFDPGLVESTAVPDPSPLEPPPPNPTTDMRFIGWDKIINMLQTDQCIFLYRRSGGVYTLHTRKMVYSENVAAPDKYGIQVAVLQRETADPGELKTEIHVTCAFPWDDIAHKELLAQLYAIFPASETRSASIRIREPVAHFVSYNPTLMAQLPRMRDIIVRVSPEEPEELCAVGFDRDAHSGECEENFVGRDLETVMFPIGKGFIPPGWGIGGTRGGEDDDDDTQDPNEPPSGAYALQCPAATRGSTGRCTVHVPDDVTAATLRYQWSSGKGATHSGGVEADSWSGKATSTTNVTVRVTDASGSEVFSDTQPATVEARPDYHPPLLAAGWSFKTRSFLAGLNNNRPTFGFYDIPTIAPSPPTAQPGSGPWTGEFVAGSAPYIPTSIYVVSDYSYAGAPYAGANSTCASSSNNVNPNGSYYEVNLYCQTWTHATGFRSQIIAHEREHQNGLNACIESANAAAIFNVMEPLVGTDEATINLTLATEWDKFFYQYFSNAGFQASAYTSTNRFWQYGTSWLLDYGRIAGHGTTVPYSC